MACVWYVSKYVTPPSEGSAGGRGYLIMREFVRLGHTCVIITSDSHQLVEVPVLAQPYVCQNIDGLQLWWVKTMRYRVAKSVRRIASWLDFEWRLWRMPKAGLPEPDAVVVSSLSLLTVLNGFWLRRQYGCSLVLEIRDIWPLTIIEEGGFSRWNPLLLGLSWIEKLGYKHADAVVGTMPNLAEHVQHVLGQAKPTHCIPMGVDEVALMASATLPPDYAKQYIPTDKFIVVHAGTIGITNALDTLLDCAALMQDRTQVHFLVVGDGDLRAHYQQKYAHLPNLTFAPKVPKAMVQAVLERCDLLYFAAHKSKVWRFGQSLNKLIDYMLAGKPVVASYTGFPSMINEAGCGTFVPASDVPALRAEIERYAAMPSQERASIGAKGREWIVANRSYRQLAQDYLRILLGPESPAPKA
jgi:glycosyltransferase involved in cell wall biosynthesis